MASSEALTFIGRWDGHRLSVLGDGATSHFNALIGQQAGNLAVAQRFGRCFRGYQFLDDGADGGG